MSSTIVERLERVIKSVTEKSEHQLFDVLIPTFGERPFDTPALDTEDQALYWCPEFFCYGNAAAPVSAAWYALVEEQMNRGQMFAWIGDQDLARFSQRMYRLVEKYPHAIVDGMTPDLAKALGELVLDGLHDLTIKPPVNAEPLEQPS